MLIFLISCNSHINTKIDLLDNYYEIKIINSLDTIDFLAEGKKYEIKLICDNNYKNKYIINNKPVFIILRTFFSDSSNQINLVKQFKISNDKRYLVADFEVPFRASYIGFNIFDENQYNYSFPSSDFGVFRETKNGYIFAESGIITSIRMDTSKKKYLDFIEWELNHYPNNGLIYATKWLYEMKNYLFNTEVIKSDLMKIKSSNNFSLNQKMVLAFIGYSLIKDSDSIKHYQESLYDIKDSKIFNNEDVCNSINAIFNFTNLDQKTKESITSNIVFNNPLTYFTKTQIGRGYIYSLDPSISNFVLNARINSSVSSYVDLLAYSEILVYKFNKYKENNISRDSIEKGRLILNQLKELIGQPFSEYHVEKEIGLLKAKKQIIFSSMLSVYLVQKDYYGLIDKANQLLSEIKVIEPVISSLYFEKGRAFQQLNQNDSARKYYLLSVALEPGNEFFRKQLSDCLIKTHKGKVDVDSFIDSLVINTTLPKFKLDSTAPNIKTTIENVNLLNNDKAIILEFFSTSCQPCQKNIDLLIRNYNSLNDVNIFLISGESPPIVKDYLKMKSNKFQFVANGNELMQYFRIGSVPETIIIDRHGYIVKRFTGEYSERFFTSLNNSK